MENFQLLVTTVMTVVYGFRLLKLIKKINKSLNQSNISPNNVI